MKILHLVPSLDSGGVETGTVDLALALKKLGHTVIVISSGGRLVGDLANNGIRHITLPVHKKSLLIISNIPKVASIIKSHGINIVHASSRVPAWIGFFASKITKTPFVTSCHGFYSRHLFSHVMGWGKFVMVISKSIGDRMTGAFGVRKEKIRLVYRGVDLTKYEYLPEKYARNKEFHAVINIGRLTKIKGHFEFIRAMKRVIEEVGDAEAWIVGSPAKGKERYADNLKALSKALGIEKNIKFLGTRDDIGELLKKAGCLVLSSNVPEGFGRTLIEAGAVGTACCASDIGGIKEIIEDGVSGILFPPRNEAKMADAIIRLLTDLNLSGACAANLRRRVESSFTLDRMAQGTLSVYEEALR